MPEPYFTGDNVPIKFNASYESSEGPTSAKVTIRNPHNLCSEEADATVDGQIVAYVVPQSFTTERGEYAAWFVCTFSYGDRTYEAFFAVEPNPRLI